MNKCRITNPSNLPTECVEIAPMPLDVRRQLMERQTWINNVVRVLGMTYHEAEIIWVKIQLAKYE